jgi:hypothetical protein
VRRAKKHSLQIEEMFMKSFWKLGLIATTLAATSAFADVAAPNTGNGELTLFVKNTTTNEVYARGLGIFIDDVLPESVTGGAYSGRTEFNYVLPSVATDPALASFLGNVGNGYTWGILAGDSVGTTAAVGSRRYLLTSDIESLTTTQAVASGTNLASLSTNAGQFFSDLNANLPDGAGTHVIGDGNTGGLWGIPGTSGANAPIFFNFAPNDDSAAVGTAMRIFVLANNTTNGAQARVFYASAQIRLNQDGSLSVLGGGGPVVPIPAAVWLFGSGMLGLFGIGRRRSLAAQAKA